jgi:hypothetical protein
MLIAGSCSMAMALYPVVAGDGTGNRPLFEWDQREIPEKQRPLITAREGVITDTTDNVDDVVDEVEDTVDD